MSAITSRPRITNIIVSAEHRTIGATTSSFRAADGHETLVPSGSQKLAFVDALVSACTRASAAAGFAAVETRLTSAGIIRVIAESKSGHVLVSEIDLEFGRFPSIATEVVGAREGRCDAILDRFDEALEREGVRSAPARRSHTGGVATLAAARALYARVKSTTHRVEDSRSAPAAHREARGRARVTPTKNRQGQ